MARHRAVLGLGFALIVLAAVPASALGNNDDYACQLTPKAFVKQEFRLPHEKSFKNPGGGTDEQDGAFSSICILIAYRHFPPPHGVAPFGRAPAYRVRKGWAKLIVTTTVQDEGSGGENWDPEKFRLSQLEARDQRIEEYGGRGAQFPLYGKSEVFGLQWATEADNASATWRDGEDGFITLDVGSHGGPAGQHLATIAGRIVPHFTP